MTKRLKTKEEIELWLLQMKIENYTINEDLTVDVNKYVDISNQKLTLIPIQFGKVSLDFFCYSNSLTSLKGCPKYVGGTFSCEYNNLTSLLGAPAEVGGDFDCHNNNLRSINHMPKLVGGEIISKNNPFEETTIRNLSTDSNEKEFNDISVDKSPTQLEKIIQNSEFKKMKLKA